MSKSTYATAALLLVLALAGAGCGSSGTAAPTTPVTTRQTPSPSETPSTGTLADSDTCFARTDARYATVPSGLPLEIAILGHSPRAVVLANQSDRFACSWLPFARRLVRAGYEVAFFDYEADPVADATAVAGYVRRHGARSVSMVGASQGAMVAIIAGATVRPRPAAVISLSPEVAVGSMDVASYAPRLQAPALLVTATKDPLGSAETTAAYIKQIPGRPKERMAVPGERHGIELLSEPKVMLRVLGFLRAGS